MHFKRMGRKGDHRLNIPLLSGGINADTDPTLIADNELVSCVNMELRDGALRTRKALRTDESEFSAIDTDNATITDRISSVCREPIEMDGVKYAVAISSVSVKPAGGNITAKRYIDLVPLTANGQPIRYEMPTPGVTLGSVAVAPCDASRYHTPFLVYCNNDVYRKEGDGFAPVPDEELYAPLVMINGKSAVYRNADETYTANGVMYEGFNVLTPRYRARFTSAVGNLENCSEAFVMPTYLDASGDVTMEITTSDGITAVTMRVDGEAVALDIGDGISRTAKATDQAVIVNAPLPASVVSDNVTVTATAHITDSHRGSVAGATIAAWFGGTQNRNGGTRLFLTGFDKSVGGMGACMMWSDVDNPLYFPQNNYMHVGDLSQRITALAKQEDMLVVFKEREMYYTRYVEGSVDAENVLNGTNVDVTVSAAYFPLTQLSPVVGCNVPATVTLCRDRLVWMNDDGRVYTLRTANAYSERNVREIGGKIRNRLLAVSNREDRKKACAMDVEGRYHLLIGRKAFVFDYAASGFVNQSSYRSDKRAADNIAWFEHHYDALPNEPLSRDTPAALVSDGGDEAVLIVTRHLLPRVYCRSRWYFEEEENDSRIAEDDVTVIEEPIESSFVTKSYSFGNAAVEKRVKALFMNVDTDHACLQMTADGREDHAVRRLRGDGERMQLILPGVKRCQTLGFTLEARTPVAVKSLQLHYQNLDVIR